MGVYGYAYCAQTSSVILRVTYFCIQLVLGSLILYFGGATGFNAMIFLPLAGHSVVLLPELWRYAINAVIALVYAISLRWISGAWDLPIANLPVFLAGQVFILVFTQMALSEEKSRREIQQLADELAVANQQLRKYAGQVEMLAIEKERNRMAREIHDGIGHHLTALNMQVKAAKAVLAIDPQRSNDLLENSERLSQRALMDVRQSVAALRENRVDSANLTEKIQETLNNAQNSGLNVKFSILGTPRILTPEASLTLFRAVQESASNTLKHAGASIFSLVLSYEVPNAVNLVIKDDGVGAEGLKGGFGLIGLRERIQLLDGRIDIQTSKGHGFEIRISIPE
jgi:signal transduction histidine kinase